MIKKIKEILHAYSIMLSPTENQNKIAISRLLQCNKCPSNKINSVGLNYCSECGCLIKGKVFSKENTCPLNKWEY